MTVESHDARVLRRSFVTQSTRSLGGLALAGLLDKSLFAASTAKAGSPQPWQGVVRPLHHPARIKRVIFLYMSGGPSHLETFDYKPKLARMDREPMPESFTAGQPIAQLQGQELVCLAPQFRFKKHGQSGQEISDILPHTASVADEICIVRSMVTDQINHDPAHTVMNTGTSISGRPSMGSWLTYGLGSESEDLPGFVVMTSFGGRNPQPLNNRQWHNGFLPGQFQGVRLHTSGDAVHYLSRPPGISSGRQRDVIDAVAQLNRDADLHLRDSEIETRTQQYELAFRMQTSIPSLFDISDEPRHIRQMYGVEGVDGSFASNCLLARRMAERGVRFIQLYHRDWDHHGDLVHYMNICCGLTDQPAAALLRDLKQRGMLDETLVIWGGEFGRTPMSQPKGKELGRDHHMKGFSMWLAGGGVRGGMTYGATDDLGYNSVENIVHVNDLHATMLHLFGIDHERLTYRFQGRDFRLTDVGGKVIHDILT